MTDLILRLFASAVFGAAIGWVYFFRQRRELNPDNGEQRYIPYVNSLLLPVLTLLIPLTKLLTDGADSSVSTAITLFFGVFFHVTVYYALLMLALPLFRRHISARACALLWIIPNFLYYTSANFAQLPAPLWMLRLPGIWAYVLCGIWFAGFLAVLSFHIFTHLRFRRQILKAATPICDSKILAVFDQAVADANLKKPKRIPVYSAAVTTPLSIGLFRGTIQLVLPQREYTQEELALIFRHEIVHICREDYWSKFFLAFCTAMCWFNPLMWIAMRKCGEDMELSCDETVLLTADKQTRQQYAELLLRTAGDNRGFTTCLSPAAASMRHRLQSICHPRIRSTGAVCVALVFFLLFATCGYVGVTYNTCAGSDLLFTQYAPTEYTLVFMGETTADKQQEYTCDNPQALQEYLLRLPMEHIGGNYSFSTLPQKETRLTLCYEHPYQSVFIELYSHFINIVKNGRSVWYYLPQQTDWTLLKTLMAPA